MMKSAREAIVPERIRVVMAQNQLILLTPALLLQRELWAVQSPATPCWNMFCGGEAPIGTLHTERCTKLRVAACLAP